MRSLEFSAQCDEVKPSAIATRTPTHPEIKNHIFRFIVLVAILASRLVLRWHLLLRVDLLKLLHQGIRPRRWGTRVQPNVPKHNHPRDCAKYIVLSLPRPCEVPVEITREKIVEDAFKNGTYATLGVQLARFQEQDRRNSELISYRPCFPSGFDDSCR